MPAGSELTSRQAVLRGLAALAQAADVSKIGVPHGFRQRLIINFFGLTVLGHLWTWIPVLLLLLFTRSLVFGALVVIYYAYIWGPGYKAALSESWPAPLRHLGIWKQMAHYFPASLVKTVDLDPNGRYIFTCEPHGITSISAWVNFGTNATGFDTLFPGLTNYCMTLDINFKAPLVREWCLLHGLRSCSRMACARMLRKPGNSILLVPGGAAEALITQPGRYDLLLSKRKGFAKIALLSGASLVPVIFFGEPDLYSTHVFEKGSVGWRLQQLSHRLFKTSQPVFWGVGLFTKSGVLPYARPLVSVVGTPIPVQQVSKEQAQGPEFDRKVDELHAKFTQALLALWDAHKDKYAPDRKGDMQLVQQH